MTVVPRGTDGAVSVVGTFAGIVASIFLASVGCIITMVLPQFPILVSKSMCEISPCTSSGDVLRFFPLLKLVLFMCVQTDVSGAVICVVAAQVANLCESFIGAALQDQKGSEWVRLLSFLYRYAVA